MPTSHVPLSFLGFDSSHITDSAHKDAEFESSFNLTLIFFSCLFVSGTWYAGMGKSFDDLLCFLLEEIALCGNQGTF